jgi:hypothetical protein
VERGMAAFKTVEQLPEDALRLLNQGKIHIPNNSSPLERSWEVGKSKKLKVDQSPKSTTDYEATEVVDRRVRKEEDSEGF